MRFLFKAVIIYFREKKRVDYKNNYEHNKLANFWLNNISKIYSKILIIISSTLSNIRLRNI